MNIKKLFINFIIVLFIGVVILSVVTVVRRSNEPKDEFVLSNRNQSLMIGDASVDTEATETTEVTEVTEGSEPDEQDATETRTMYLQDAVNVRSGPGTDFPREGRLARNTEVTVIGEPENGWQKIIYGDAEAYVSGEYLSETPVEDAPEQTQPTQPEATPDSVPVPQPESTAQPDVTPQPDTTPQQTPTPEPAPNPENPPEQENSSDTPVQPEVSPEENLPDGGTTPAEPEIPPAE